LTHCEEFKNVKILKVDVDELSEIAEEEGVRREGVLPTFKIYKHGKVVKTIEGAKYDQLIETIATHM
jgi:thioredoxin 1